MHESSTSLSSQSSAIILPMTGEATTEPVSAKSASKNDLIGMIEVKVELCLLSMYCVTGKRGVAKCKVEGMESLTLLGLDFRKAMNL